jgi:hypothetical protein
MVTIPSAVTGAIRGSERASGARARLRATPTPKNALPPDFEYGRAKYL